MWHSYFLHQDMNFIICYYEEREVFMRIFLCLPVFKGVYPDQFEAGNSRNLAIREALQEHGTVVTHSTEHDARPSGVFSKVDTQHATSETPVTVPSTHKRRSTYTKRQRADFSAVSASPTIPLLAPLDSCQALVAYILSPNWNQMTVILHAIVHRCMPTLILYLSPRVQGNQMEGGKPVLQDGRPVLVSMDAIAPPEISVLAYYPKTRLRSFPDIQTLQGHFRDFFGGIPSERSAS